MNNPWRVYEKTANSMRLVGEYETKREAVRELAGALSIMRIPNTRDYVISRSA